MATINTMASMTTNGYTRVPHDIARCAQLSLAARAVWTLIAGMNPGYRPTLGQWLEMAGVSENTWRKVIKELESARLVIVRGGRRPVYEAVFSSSNTQILREKGSNFEPQTLKFCASNTQILREKGSNFEPIRRTIEEQENCESACAHVRDFFELVKNDTAIQEGCRILKVDHERYLQLVEEVTREWRFTNAPIQDWNLKHFIGQARIKQQIKQRQENNETTKAKRTDRRRPSDVPPTITEADTGKF